MDSSAAHLLRGLLESCLFSLLAEHADYGLSLAQRLATAGLDEVPGSMLYPVLMRLEKRGLVAVPWRPSISGPARKYYELTDVGHTEFAMRRAEWCTFSIAVGILIEGRRVRTEALS